MNQQKFITSAAIASSVLSTSHLINSITDRKSNQVFSKLKKSFKPFSSTAFVASISKKYNVTNGLALSNNISLFQPKDSNNTSFVVDKASGIEKEISLTQLETYAKFLKEFHIDINQNDKNRVAQKSKIFEPKQILEIKNVPTYKWSFKKIKGNAIVVTSKFRKQPTVSIA